MYSYDIAIRRMTQILGNVRVKFMTQPLCHKYFSWLTFACSKFTIETLEQGVNLLSIKTPEQCP